MSHALILSALLTFPADDEVTFVRGTDRVELRVAGKPFAVYVMADDKVRRPYFMDLRGPNGTAVTRTHPPVKGKDAIDHDTMHPGLWLAFSDLGGADGWRNKAAVVHERFVREPGNGSFTVLNQHRTNDGKATVALETANYRVLPRPGGTLLVWSSTFAPGGESLVFGDQEEMGLGVRLASPLTVKAGGRIVNSKGHKNETQVWGQTADWCDYGGPAGGKRAGIVLMNDPANVRPPWFHARDYGLLVANPFGRNAFTRGEKSRLEVKRGDTLILRYGIYVYDGVEGPGAADVYRDFLSVIGARP